MTKIIKFTKNPVSHMEKVKNGKNKEGNWIKNDEFYENWQKFTNELIIVNFTNELFFLKKMKNSENVKF